MDALDTVIIGSGFAGLCTAIRLKKAGIHSFVILEKDTEVGGTWYVNSYPGAACDIASHLYCFSFEPNPNWSRTFATQPEIQQYILHCTEKYGIRPHVRFGTQATEAVFDETSSLWTVHTLGQATFQARFLILGTGGLSIPSIPDIKGMANFTGPHFHSAEWNHQVNLEGKNIAVIGTGASTVQFVPQIAGKANRLHLFQRTPPWVLPRPDRAYSKVEKWLFSNFSVLVTIHRLFYYWRNELQGIGFVKSPKLLRIAQFLGKRNIAKGIKDLTLRKKVTPDFHIGCKRILMANDYYTTLAQPNVEVVTTGIREITPQGIIDTDGREYPVDAIIYGTGFRVSDYLWPLVVRGRGGIALKEVWDGIPEAYLGITVTGFPNMFMLCGPNTGLGHNSMVFIIESQVNFIVDCIMKMRRDGLIEADIRAEVQKAYAQEMMERMSGTVWQTGCKSWYLDNSGRNFTLWPGFTFEYRMRTRKADLKHFEVKE